VHLAYSLRKDFTPPTRHDKTVLSCLCRVWCAGVSLLFVCQDGRRSSRTQAAARPGRGSRSSGRRARSTVTRLSWSVRLRPLHRDAAAEKATRGTSRGACCELVPQRSVPPHRFIFCYLSRRLLRWRVRCSWVLARRRHARLPISDCRVRSVRAWRGRVDVLLYRSDVDSIPST